MPFPAQVQTVEVRVGPYLGAGGAPLVGARVLLTPEWPLVHEPTGLTVLATAAVAVTGIDGAGSVIVPAADAAGLTRRNHRYQVSYDFGRVTPPSDPFFIRLPAADPIVRLSGLVPAAGPDGTTVFMPGVTSIAGYSGSVTGEMLAANAYFLQAFIDAAPLPTGEQGDTGLSAYDLAVLAGYVGTRDQWLASLVGPAGLSAYTLAVQAGFVGDLAAWLASLKGNPGATGADAYAVAVAAGFTGTRAQWLASLVGAKGDQGPRGIGAVGLLTMGAFSGSKPPTLTKYAGNPIATRAQVGLSTIYTPCMIRVPAEVYAANPTMGRWRIYTSTDHDTGDGGVAMLYTNAVNPDDPGAVWQFWRAANGTGVKMFYDGVGKQTETPTVIVNPLAPPASRFHMYYQREFGTGSTLVQTTCLATSPDGLTWTVVGPCLLNPSPTLAGYDHTGYFKPWYLDGLWAGLSNVGSGTTVTSQALWYSYDGVTWIRDPKMMRGQLQFTDGSALRTTIAGMFRYRGKLWCSAQNGEFTSGTQTSSVVQPYLAPLRDDLRGLAGRPQYVPNWGPVGSETTMPGVPSYWAEADDGRLWGAYRMNGATGAFGLAVMA